MHDFMQVLASYHTTPHLHLDFHIIYPNIKLEFRQVHPFKIVSTPLSKELARSRSQKYRTGLMTMDSMKRLLLILGNDTISLKYPCVGIWISGVQGPVFQNHRVWACCMRYILNKTVKLRLSPEPRNHRFLLTVLGSSLQFYEVAFTRAEWRVLSSRHKPSGNEPLRVNFLQVQKPPLLKRAGLSRTL